MDGILSTIRSPQDLKALSLADLERLADQMREALCRLLGTRSAHFASNLGVIELTLALHTTFDFLKDRLIWDTGHQIYPHKMVTGRYDEFPSIRAKGGLMGYPNPSESPYDLFMTGHAGCSVATALGMKCGDDLVVPEDDRHAVAVIGDGSFASGIVLEAMNNAGGLKKNITVVLNDNKMAICPRVGGLGDCLDRLRMTASYSHFKAGVQKWLHRLPVVGSSMERVLHQVKDAVKAGMSGGMLFEDLGFRYIGPVDGHNLGLLQKYLAMVRSFEGPVLLHVVTEKGHGFQPAVADPTTYHAPAPFSRENGSAVPIRQARGPSYTLVARDAVFAAMCDDPRVAVITAAMCQGNKLEPVRERFPERFFDVGICESHAVAFAAGLAKSGLRPIVDVYSTFMQRAYDQIFQEMALQNLPVLLMLDRAGVVGPDGPTHHGVFDLAYLRPFPNMAVMAPGDSIDLPLMVQFALRHDGPTAIRYPKAAAETIDREAAPIELGVAETLRFGADGVIVACGGPLAASLAAADRLREEGLELGVINARFVKPLDTETLLRAVDQSPFVVTVEEGALAGGFGSALLEAASDAGLAGRIHRLGVPDGFVEHGDRAELLADLNLDQEGIARACRRLAAGPLPLEPAECRRAR